MCKMDINANPQNSSDQIDKVCIIGSGNWGSAISTIVGRNCERLPFYEDRVNMWVFEEEVVVDGSKHKLTEIINIKHENVKYLPGIEIPSNVKAVPDLETACRNATLLIFVLPHQFLPRLLPTIRAAAHPNCRGVSLIKGLGKFIVVKFLTKFWNQTLSIHAIVLRYILVVRRRSLYGETERKAVI